MVSHGVKVELYVYKLKSHAQKQYASRAGLSVWRRGPTTYREGGVGDRGITASYNGQVLEQSLLYPRQHSYSPTQPFPTSGHEDCDVVFPAMVLCM